MSTGTITGCAALRLPRASPGCPRPPGRAARSPPRRRCLGGAVPSAGCRWRYQSLVSLAHGVMIRTRHEPKSTSTAASTSTPMTRPRPYASWVTRSRTANCSAGGAADGRAKGLVGKKRRDAARAGFITISMRLPAVCACRQYAPAGPLATGSAGLARLPADGSPGGCTALPASRRICASHKPGRRRRRGVAPAARDDRQVMRDSRQVREAKAALKIEHQVENLRPHGHGAPATVHASWHRLAACPCSPSWLCRPRVDKDSARL